MTQKPTLMILGSHHMANPGLDGFNFQADDVLTPKRQREIEQLTDLLREFKPTKVAVEGNPKNDVEEQEKYRNYLNDKYQLGRSEAEQIGFRLAKKMGHLRIYPVDWNENPPTEQATWDPEAFAKANSQQALWENVLSKGRETIARGEEIQRNGSLIDLYRHVNQDENIREDHRIYFTIAQIGNNDQYVGANWVQYWYGRNLKIFVNLTRITESDEDRILLIIGAGHVRLLQQFVSDSGYFFLESPLKYLN